MRAGLSTGPLAAMTMIQSPKLPVGQTIPPAPHPDPAKWRVLDDLRGVAADYGLGPAVLRTLQVLVGFIRPERGDFTVFAGNRSICERLMGASERTLQRHVRTLEAAGLLRRADSASGRRFRQSDGICFGLDLQPLYARADSIGAAAEAEAARQEETRNRRRVAMARLYALPLDPETRAVRARCLRRAQSAEAIAGIVPEADILPDTPPGARPMPDPDRMTAPPRQAAGDIPNTQEDSLSVRQAENSTDMPLGLVLDACPEIKATFGQEPKTWREALAMAAQIAGYLGIGAAVWQAALSRMGQMQATVTLFLMLQRLPLIRTPAAYLRGLVKRCADGRLNLRAQVMALSRRRDAAS